MPAQPPLPPVPGVHQRSAWSSGARTATVGEKTVKDSTSILL
jgi:hypothetical protein